MCMYAVLTLLDVCGCAELCLYMLTNHALHIFQNLDVCKACATVVHSRGVRFFNPTLLSIYVLVRFGDWLLVHSGCAALRCRSLQYAQLQWVDMSATHHRRRQLLQALLPDVVSRLEGVAVMCTTTTGCLSRFIREVRYVVGELALQLLRYGLIIIELDVRTSDDGAVEMLYDVASYDPASRRPIDPLLHIVVVVALAEVGDKYVATPRVLYTFYSYGEEGGTQDAAERKSWTSLSQFMP